VDHHNKGDCRSECRSVCARTWRSSNKGRDSETPQRYGSQEGEDQRAGGAGQIAGRGPGSGGRSGAGARARARPQLCQLHRSGVQGADAEGRLKPQQAVQKPGGRSVDMFSALSKASPARPRTPSSNRRPIRVTRVRGSRLAVHRSVLLQTHHCYEPGKERFSEDRCYVEDRIRSSV
jgi:hypothetical protein